MFTGEEIKKKRKQLKLSAKELADRLKVNAGNLYKWEKGHTPTNPEDFLKIEKWLKSENVPVSENGSVALNKAQGSPQSQKQGLDLIKEVSRLDDDQLRIMATLKVLVSEIEALIVKNTGRSAASVSLQLEKDISENIENLKTLRGRM